MSRNLLYLTFKPLGDIDNDRDEEYWENVAEQVPGVAPVKIMFMSDVSTNFLHSSVFR